MHVLPGWTNWREAPTTKSGSNLFLWFSAILADHRISPVLPVALRLQAKQYVPNGPVEDGLVEHPQHVDSQACAVNHHLRIARGTKCKSRDVGRKKLAFQTMCQHT